MNIDDLFENPTDDLPDHILQKIPDEDFIDQSPTVIDQKPVISSPAENNILSIIERVAMSPDADIDKLEKMLDLQERIIDKNSAQAFAAAMSLCQGEMPSVVKSAKNNQTHSTYAKFEDILEKSKPVYTKHGFALSFGTDQSPIENHIRITCDISHSQGHTKHFFQDLPIDNQGMGGKVNKTLIHGTASTFTYGRRYLFTMIFNIAVTDDDNDGNQIQQHPKINSEQVSILNDLINRTQTNQSLFNKFFKIEKIEDIYLAHFDQAKKMLESKL